MSKSSVLGFNAIEGLSISFLIWLDALSFPFFLRKGYIIVWMIMTGVCLFIPFLILSLHKPKKIQGPQIKTEDTSNLLLNLALAGAAEEESITILKKPETEAEEKLEAEAETEAEEVLEAKVETEAEEVLEAEVETEAEEELEAENEPESERGFETKPMLVIDPYPIEQGELPGYNIFQASENEDYPLHELSALSFEKLLEEGFKEKQRGAYQKAAENFYSALKTKPESDLAYYLIIDCYSLWKLADSGVMALTKLEPFIKDFRHEANEEWRIRLETWLLENHIEIE